MKVRLTEVISDGNTIWVNGNRGECLGRFGKYGVDVHHTVDEQLEGKGQCLHCTHERPTLKDWDDFVQSMLTVYGVQLSAYTKPDWLTA